MTALTDRFRPVAQILVTITTLTVALASCAAAPSTHPTSSSHGEEQETAGHGDVAGATQVAEPPLQLVSVAADGSTGILDLLDGSTETLTGVSAASALASDGRYAFLTTVEGLQIVDSGVWSWDHGDHFHYYRTAPTVIGVVPGSGSAVVSTGPLSTAGSTGVVFAGSAEAVLLENAALARGEIVEQFRLPIHTAETAILAPTSHGAALADDGRLTLLDASGTATGDDLACTDPAGSITTRVGLIIGCTEGAVLVDAETGEPELIAAPGGAALPVSFTGRKGRPSVAGIAPGTGFWLLDTRARSWTLVPTDAALIRVVAVDDADGHVVALDADGRIRVFAAGVETAVSEPLLSGDPSRSELIVDAQRAYLNDPDAGTVLEIDYADGARVARTLTTPTTPTLVTEVGR